MARTLSGIFEMRKFLFFPILFVGLLWGAEARTEPTHEITVSAAVSLRNAFQDIGKIFQQKKPRARLLFNFGASGDLARQIEGGAPVDVFASASSKEMDDLDRRDMVVKGTRKDFAGNKIVLITPVRSAIHLISFKDLKREGIKRIAVGNPKTVPAGRYAVEVLSYFNLSEAIKDRLIFAENVRQVLDYVARGEVDAGIVYSTDASTRATEVKIVADAPKQSHREVVYPVAVVKGSKNEGLGRAFISVVTSKEGKKILQRYGFGISDEVK